MRGASLAQHTRSSNAILASSMHTSCKAGVRPQWPAMAPQPQPHRRHRSTTAAAAAAEASHASITAAAAMVGPSKVNWSWASQCMRSTALQRELRPHPSKNSRRPSQKKRPSPAAFPSRATPQHPNTNNPPIATTAQFAPHAPPAPPRMAPLGARLL